MTEHVVLFAGPMGAGKTTAIRSISEIPVVSTEAANTDRERVDKPTTTVALDYGEIALSDHEKVRLYGVPGQRRFRFMWQILKERARGMVLLVNNDAEDPVADALAFLEQFDDLHRLGCVVIGITRTDIQPWPTVATYVDAFERARPGRVVPVFTVDPRDHGDVRMAMLALIATIEMRETYGVDETASV